MEMKIETVATICYTVELTDEDVRLVEEWIQEHKDDLSSSDMRNNILKTVNHLRAEGKISLYEDGKYTESDFSTEKIQWSEFEWKEPEEILNE